MANTVTVVRSPYNIPGDSGGVATAIVYTGPTLDMDAAGSPITSSNTYKVWRKNESTGAWESYVPGGGSNDFHVLDRGSLNGAVAVGQGLGRGYVIVAKSPFLLSFCRPAA
jgi:hypothetical protein